MLLEPLDDLFYEERVDRAVARALARARARAWRGLP
jgi:hypothetical protein